MGQVLPGLRLLDGRYLFAGLLANLFGIISIFFVTRPFLAAAMIVSGWFTVGGFMKKGSLNSTTAEGLLLLLGLSLAFALAVTLASLLTLRRLSAKN